MPKGPKGEKRPADVVGAAIKVAKIATREIEEDTEEPQSAAAELGRKGGKHAPRNDHLTTMPPTSTVENRK